MPKFTVRRFTLVWDEKTVEAETENEACEAAEDSPEPWSVVDRDVRFTEAEPA